MNLEYLEEQCVKYLAQTTNPLVALDTLFAYLMRDPKCTAIDKKELYAFLREHDLFHIMDDFSQSDDETAAQLEEMNISTGPRVILRTRIPPRAELTGLIERQLLAMTEQTDKPCGAADDIARRHLDAVDRKIGKLRALRSELQRMLDSCDHGRVRDCRIVKTLADHGQCLNEGSQGDKKIIN